MEDFGANLYAVGDEGEFEYVLICDSEIRRREERRGDCLLERSAIAKPGEFF